MKHPSGKSAYAKKVERRLHQKSNGVNGSDGFDDEERDDEKVTTIRSAVPPKFVTRPEPRYSFARPESAPPVFSHPVGYFGLPWLW
ncbi:MAG: hypothetical protein NT077_04390 [Candidatus Taylorbacteria bacterium]|nr:hypothetical protein [Candidatus Taylorbacteria bacterium]